MWEWNWYLYNGKFIYEKIKKEKKNFFIYKKFENIKISISLIDHNYLFIINNNIYILFL